jgi:hypothetical protein
MTFTDSRCVRKSEWGRKRAIFFTADELKFVADGLFSLQGDSGGGSSLGVHVCIFVSVSGDVH